MKLRAEGVALGESFNRMKLRAEGGALDESFNQLKLWLKVWRRMKFQPVETLAEGAASDEVSTG